MRDPYPRSAYHNIITGNGNVTFQSLTFPQRLHAAHESLFVQFLRYWHHHMPVSLEMNIEALKYLEIDLTNAFCPTGCCRSLVIPRRWIDSLRPTKVVILGLCEHEEGQFRQILSYPSVGVLTAELRFGEQWDAWSY